MDSPTDTRARLRQDTRARLRQELQQAYGAWLRASERGDGGGDGSGGGDGAAPVDAGPEWRAYLAARQRLATACAEAAAAD
jgi:hypothetical protein